MSGLLWSALMFGGGLVVGWVFLPEPMWFRRLWARTGIADRD